MRVPVAIIPATAAAAAAAATAAYGPGRELLCLVGSILQHHAELASAERLTLHRRRGVLLPGQRSSIGARQVGGVHRELPQLGLEVRLTRRHLR